MGELLHTMLGTLSSLFLLLFAWLPDCYCQCPPCKEVLDSPSLNGMYNLVESGSSLVPHPASMKTPKEELIVLNKEYIRSDNVMLSQILHISQCRQQQPLSLLKDF